MPVTTAPQPLPRSRASLMNRPAAAAQPRPAAPPPAATPRPVGGTPSLAKILPGLIAPQPAAPPPPAPPAPGKTPFDLLLVQFYRSQLKPGQTQITIPMAEAARHFNLLATPENMKAFASWFNSLASTKVFGPKDHKLSATASVGKDPQNPEADIRALQTGLARRGYGLQVTGVYDGATERAVVAFKKAYGFHEAYKTPDGHFAVNPFASEQVAAAILRVS